MLSTNKSKGFAVALLMASLLWSCSNTMTLEENIAAVEQQRNEIANEKNPERIQLTDSLYVLYDSFINVHKEHEKSPIYMIKLAEYENGKGNVLAGANLFKRFVESYPQHEEAPSSLFKAAIIFETSINDLVHAKKLYNRLIAEYPKSKEAETAKRNMEVLNSNKTLEELIEGFEAQNKGN